MGFARGGRSITATVLVALVCAQRAALPALASECVELQVTATPIELQHVQLTPSGGPSGPMPRGQCPPVVNTYSSANFSGGQVVVQAGMVETEIAAVSFTLDALAFPILINQVEIIWAQQNATVTTTTAWSVLVWQGTPNLSQPMATFSSDGEILPHVILPPGTTGANLQFSVDPGDPEQIVVQDNGSHKFSVGFRIDDHHNEPVASCSCGLGTLPAVCCPPPPSSNAFPTTDVGGIASPANNWLFARDCPGTTGFCDILISPGWTTNSAVGITGDWNIRVTYTPFDCAARGACCFASGVCTMSQPDVCASQGGVFQGEGIPCSPNPCPQPTGACCREDGTCDDAALQNTCQAAHETFFLNETCANVSCPEPVGGCCISGTCIEMLEADCVNQAGGTYLGDFVNCGESACDGACCFSTNNCLFLSEAECDLIDGGVFQGVGTVCGAGNTCPRGACCLPLGSCQADQTPLECAAADGVYQGNAIACETTNCPIPTGACCLSSGGCINNLSPADCLLIPNAFWPGEGTICPAACTSCPVADGDLNGDGLINGVDVPAFAAALLNGASQDQTCAGDFNESQSLDTGDVDGFVLALLAAP